MKILFTAIKYDYLQRTRSYAFLITLCASLAIAYTFVPEPNANYSTIRIADYVGYYNSAWFGYVTAIMTSVFLSLIGFYLVNSGIKTDGDTKVGQVIAATSLSNFTYLSYKTVSNFLMLLTIVCAVFVMSIVLFFLYHDGFPFEPLQFIWPYLLIILPALFFIAVLAVLFEVLFGKYSAIQNVGFFFLFAILMVYMPKTDSQFMLDVFGNKIVIHQMEETVREILHTDEKTDLTIGYVLGNVKQANKFVFNGIDFPASFVLSRFLWIFGSIALIALMAPYFHRFSRNDRLRAKKLSAEKELPVLPPDVGMSNLPVAEIDYGILPILKTELILLIRKGKKWLWLLNLLGMVLLVILPLKISHQLVLPILWFLQVGRVSEIITKEQSNNVRYFAFTSYRPLSRVLFSQLLSAFVLLLFLALPLLIRLALYEDFTSLFSIVLGSLLLVCTSAALGILSKGKKLFEVLFFMITYANINAIPFVDYFGGFEHGRSYHMKLIVLVVILSSITFWLRTKQMKK